MTARLLSTTPFMAVAIRRAIRDGVTVDYGVPGITLERPWGVVAPATDRKGHDQTEATP